MINGTLSSVENGMASFAEKLLQVVKSSPGLTDRQITDRLFGRAAHPSQVNQEARLLERKSLLTRRVGENGHIGNYLVSSNHSKETQVSGKHAVATPTTMLSEDEVKKHIAAWLQQSGWQAKVAWGKARGVDIEATRGRERWIIEAKGQGSLQPMRVNYFIAMLGETLQRMSDAHAKYSIAMPDVPQFRGLWERLPSLAKERTQITAIFVTALGGISENSGK